MAPEQTLAQGFSVGCRLAAQARGGQCGYGVVNGGG